MCFGSKWMLMWRSGPCCSSAMVGPSIAAVRIIVVAVGRLRPPFADDVAHYTKLLSGHERIEVRSFLRRLRQLALLIAVIVIAGTIGLAVTEDRGLWESFQWALDTIATIGSHPNPETVPGQIVKVLLIVLGVGTLFYGLVTVTEVFVAGHLADLFAERRTLRAIEATSDHYIICGFGRVGRQVARDLRAAGARYVVIDDNPENRELAAGIGVRFLQGQATEDEVLRS